MDNGDKNRQIVTKVSKEKWWEAQKAECELWKTRSTKGNPTWVSRLKFTLRNLFKGNFPAGKDLTKVNPLYDD